MSCKIRFTDTAKDDLRNIAVYIAEQSNGLVAGMILIGSRPESYARQMFNQTDLSAMSDKDKALISSGDTE